jgi:D-xylose transport system substrate-binding protein
MKRIISIVVIVALALTLVACSSSPAASSSTTSSTAPTQATSAAPASSAAVASLAASASSGKKITIGVSVGDLTLERWQRDLSYMVNEAKSKGATVYSTSGDGDATKQISQIENMLTKGIDVLIVIPVDSKVLAPIVDEAHKSNVKVIAYDRIIEDSDLDYYITFDMLGVGKLQATYLTNLVPKGNYYLQNGPKSDNNALLFRQGQDEVIQPLVQKGDIKIVADQWADGWLQENAMKEAENVLTANNNKIDAILDANDSTALGVIQALTEQKLNGKIPITGQDADLANCKAIVAGDQTMTVYKPLQNLANAAIDLAFQVATNQQITTNGTYPNGQKNVPSINLPITAADKNNMMDTIIKDGFQSYDQVYADVPAAQRPPKPSDLPSASPSAS